MSVRVTQRVWADFPYKADHTAFYVQLALADCAHNDDGTGCYPSIPFLAEKTGYTYDAVQKAVTRLRGYGELASKLRGHGGRANEYAVLTGLSRQTRAEVVARLMSGNDGEAPAPEPKEARPEQPVAPRPHLEPWGRAADQPVPERVRLTCRECGREGETSKYSATATTGICRRCRERYD
jgi:hypothetical protein